jgi:hypothetical protein
MLGIGLMPWGCMFFLILQFWPPSWKKHISFPLPTAEVITILNRKPAQPLYLNFVQMCSLSRSRNPESRMQ